MANLQCSVALLTQVGAMPGGDDPPESSPGLLGDWCAMIFPLDTRTAILFMNERTLLSFVVLEGKRIDAVALGKVFWGGLSQLLVLSGFTDGVADLVVASYPEVLLTKTKSASIRAQLSSLARDYSDLVAREGGLKRFDVGVAILNMNERPRKALRWATPLELARELLVTPVA